MSTPAGWYPEAPGAPVTRWYDGTQWTQLTRPTAPPVPGMGSPATKPRPRIGCFGAILILAFTVMVVLGLWFAIASRPGTPLSAQTECVNHIAAQLKSPSTAKFESQAEGSNPYVITGFVDAENEFGGTVRAAFQCTVTLDGDTATTVVDAFVQP